MFDLKHHSASSINKFITDRFTWWQQKTGQAKFMPNVDMCIGTAVEEGINHYIRQPQCDVIECVNVACECFKKECVGLGPIMPDKRAMVPACVHVGISSVAKNWGSELSQCVLQQEIKTPIPGCTFPAFGKLDWDFPSCVVDNKVVGKTPSELTQDYKIQGALYKFATGKRVFFHFIVKNKTPVTKLIEVTDEDYEWGMNLFTKACKAVEVIVEKSQFWDFDTVKSIFFPDPSGSWNKDEARQKVEILNSY